MKLKIIRLIARLNIGGPAIHTILLTEGLDKNKFDSLLYTGEVGPKEGDMKYYALARGVTPICISGLQREISWANDYLCLKEIYKHIKKEKPQIIHTHTAKAGTLGRLAAVLMMVISPGMGLRERKPFVLIHTFHGHIFHSYFGPLKTRFFLFLERFLARFTDRIIAISESQAYELSHVFRVAPPEKFAVIPLGFDLAQFQGVDRLKGMLREELKVSHKTVLVGIVGRLVPIKNHRMFLEAAAAFKRRHHETDIKFLIIGDGELRAELESLRDALDLSRDVIFLGWRKDLRPIYADVDIIALTSLNEGTPVAVVEAMASGRSIIATDVGGVADLLVSSEEMLTANPDPVAGRNHIRALIYEAQNGVYAAERGVLVRSGDAEGMARGIASLIRSRELREIMGRNGRVFVTERFSQKRLIRDMEALYEHAYASNRSRSSSPEMRGREDPGAGDGRSIINALTVDFEDWYQGLELSSEAGIESRMERNAQKILSLLDECRTKATFFVLGKIADEYPSLVQEIVKRGHEIGSHGHRHIPLYSLNPDEFRRDICDSLESIARAGGASVSSYRAPFFSITRDSLWAFPIMAQEGIKFDSSIFPIRYYRYGIEEAPQYPFRFKVQDGREIVEFPISTYEILNRNIPFSGGGYFRLLPYWFVKKGLRRQNKLGRPGIFYLHPWELDPGQPILRDLPRRIRFPHYINLRKTEDKLKKLLSEFRFSKLSDAIKDVRFR